MEYGILWKGGGIQCMYEGIGNLNIGNLIPQNFANGNTGQEGIEGITVPPNAEGQCPEGYTFVQGYPGIFESFCYKTDYDPTSEDEEEDEEEGPPRPDRNGQCPAGYIGVDTNGDGINDICYPVGKEIIDQIGAGGMGGITRPESSGDLATEVLASNIQAYGDPTNFMKFAPSPLQMTDPRFYGITSFVPEGEQQNFNIGYQGVPAQMYSNYRGAGPMANPGWRGQMWPTQPGVIARTNAQTAAQGGLMSLAAGGFPRRNGQIAGPGTETSDDIPAMLSDGEFVVNAKALRGIGNLMGKRPKSKAAQRREGARAMYELQKKGERAAGMRGHP